MNNKKNKKYFIWIILSILVLILLTIIICKFSYAIWNNTFTGTKNNEIITAKISLNHTDNNNQIIQVKEPKVLSDEEGIKIPDDEAYEFNISATVNSIIEYNLIIIPQDNTIDNKYIKFYLTNSSNEAVGTFKNTIPTLKDLKDEQVGKLLHCDKLDQINNTNSFKLRIWISNEVPEVKVVPLTYQLQLKTK